MSVQTCVSPPNTGGAKPVCADIRTNPYNMMLVVDSGVNPDPGCGIWAQSLDPGSGSIFKIPWIWVQIQADPHHCLVACW